LKIKN
jgi:hypothetical protein